MSQAETTSGRVEYLDPASLDDNPANWKFHPPEQLEVIERSVERFGHLKPLGTYNERTRRLLDGHARKSLYAGKGPVPIWVVDLAEEDEAEALATLDPSGWYSLPDKAKFTALLDKIKAPDENAKRMFDSIKRASVDLNPPDEPEREADPQTVEISLDTIWPSSNPLDIADLDAKMCADAIPSPVYTWGAIGHTRHMPGTYHFYTHDYKFEPLWKKPGKVKLSGCSVAVEPNFSTTDQTPLWYALHQIGRKRWMGRYWQAMGLKLLVDLNVTPALNQPREEIGGLRPNLLGVPQGWPSYASRAHGNQPELLEAEFEVAREHSGKDDPLFLVCGGGRRVKSLAQEKGWVWVPEQVETSLGGRKEDA